LLGRGEEKTDPNRRGPTNIVFYVLSILAGPLKQEDTISRLDGKKPPSREEWLLEPISLGGSFPRWTL